VPDKTLSPSPDKNGVPNIRSSLFSMVIVVFLSAKNEVAKKSDCRGRRLVRKTKSKMQPGEREVSELQKSKFVGTIFSLCRKVN
jgi:hypothetical protein